MAVQKLTERQRAVLEFIHHSMDELGYPPTLREIGGHLGIRSTNGVNDHLRALERKGYLTRECMKSRTLRLVRDVEGRLLDDEPGAGRSFSPDERSPDTRAVDALEDLIEIPILGQVAAGNLAEAIQEPEDSVKIDRMLVGGNRDVFGLKVRGESMIEAGIHDGDFVFVRKQLTANRGAIVVALVGDEATCKRYYAEKDHIRLQPENSTMAPILIPKNDWRTTQILGVVVGVYRKL